jgi:hypothetical protein
MRSSVSFRTRGGDSEICRRHDPQVTSAYRVDLVEGEGQTVWNARAHFCALEARPSGFGEQKVVYKLNVIKVVAMETRNSHRGQGH